MTVTERLALDNLDTDEPSAIRDRAFEIGRASAFTFQPGWTPLFFDFDEIAKLIQPAWDEDLRVVCGFNQSGGRRRYVCLATCNAPCRHDQTEDLPRPLVASCPQPIQAIQRRWPRWPRWKRSWRSFAHTYLQADRPSQAGPSQWGRRRAWPTPHSLRSLQRCLFSPQPGVQPPPSRLKGQPQERGPVPYSISSPAAQA